MGKIKNKLIEEIKLRGLSKSTQDVYVSTAEAFFKFTKLKASKITLDDVRKYKLHLINLKRAPRSINQQISAIKFFLYSF